MKLLNLALLLFATSMMCCGLNAFYLSKPQIAAIWQGQGTYRDGRSPFQAILRVDQLPRDGKFLGTLSEPTYDNGILNINGQISQGDLNKFNATDRSRLQHAIQLYGKGIAYIAFTDPAFSQGTQIVLNCHYYAVEDTEGTLHGIWYYPANSTSDQPDGDYLLRIQTK